MPHIQKNVFGGWTCGYRYENGQFCPPIGVGETPTEAYDRFMEAFGATSF